MRADRSGGRPSPGERHSAEKKRIVDVATALISEQGLDNFRIDTLCERLGYSRQNVYRYFQGKQAILDAVVVDGCRTMAEAIAGQQSALDEPFDEQIIDGILLACDFLRGGRQLNSYSGANLSSGVRLFMANAEPVQEVLLEFLRPLFDTAKQRGELYLNMSYTDITRWIFQVAVYQLIDADYESREARRHFLLTMLSPAINAKKARANATIDSVHHTHVR